MWNRKVVKARGKQAFQRNYWRCVIVAILAVLLLGGGASSGRSRSKDTNNTQDSAHFHLVNIEIGDFKLQADSFDELRDQLTQMTGLSVGQLKAAALAIGGVVAFAMLIVSLLKLLVVNPLIVGCCHFFTRNSEQNAQITEIGRGFSPGWGHNIVAMMLRDLFIMLWSLLFVIPGIVKAYAYRMTPYILAEHPELSGTEAITLSRQMMRGNKWRSFVFDLSFIGWYILVGLTVGILAIFYVNPYKEAANAELYRAISGEFYRGADGGAEF